MIVLSEEKTLKKKKAKMMLTILTLDSIVGYLGKKNRCFSCLEVYEDKDTISKAKFIQMSVLA